MMEPTTQIAIGFVVSVALIIITQFIMAARSTKEKLEAANNLVILNSLTSLKTELFAKLDTLTEGQSNLKKKQDEIEKKLEERQKEATEKAQSIKELTAQVRRNEDTIKELKDRLKDWEQRQGMKNLTEIALTNEKYSK